MALMVTMWYDALCEIRFGDADRVAALADEMHSLVEEFALAQGKAACRWFRGWAGCPSGEAARRFSADSRGVRGEQSARDDRRAAAKRWDMPRRRSQLLLTEGTIVRARGQHADADVDPTCDH